MTISITPLAASIMVGSLPRSGITRIKPLAQATNAPTGTWARTAKPLSELGHYIYQKLIIDARTVDDWKHIEDIDPARQYTKARDHVCVVHGGSVWAQVDAVVRQVQQGDTSALREIQIVENHADCDPKKTRLVVCYPDYVPWLAAALCNTKIEAWVGFSAIREDQPRFNGTPSMCGMTAELARRAH